MKTFLAGLALGMAAGALFVWQDKYRPVLQQRDELLQFQTCMKSGGTYVKKEGRCDWARRGV